MFITGGAEGCVCEEVTFDLAAERGGGKPAHAGRGMTGRGMTGRRKVKESALSRVRLCDPVFCSPPGSSIRGVFQARILEWGAVSFSKGSS